MENFYEILGLQRTANPDDIRKAYRSLARKWHPDIWQTKSETEKNTAEENFKKITVANSTLSDPKLKARYDESLMYQQHVAPVLDTMTEILAQAIGIRKINKCPTCGGTGLLIHGLLRHRCNACSGTGFKCKS